MLHDNQDGDDDNGLMQRNGPDRTVTTIKVLPINSCGGLSKFVKSHCTVQLHASMAKNFFLDFMCLFDKFRLF